jgi:hypothetical protein
VSRLSSAVITGLSFTRVISIALKALHTAAVAFGRDEYHGLLEEVRRVYDL